MHSGLVLVIAHWVSVAIVVLVLFLMSYILVLRALLLLKERRNRDLSTVWSPILLNSERSNRDRLPSITRADRFSFLILWNTLREKIGGDAETRNWMNSVAVATEMDRLAQRLLGKRSTRKKLLAVVTLGQLRDKSQWDILSQMAVSDHALLSLAATQAIARIDPAAAVPIIVPLAVRRAGWPAAKVVSVLKAIGPDLVSKPLADAILETPDEEMQRLIPYLETCHNATALSAVHRILRGHHDDKVIGPCLYVIGKFRDKKDLKLVHRYLAHPRWHVRAHAATCLGRIGTKEDEEKLVALLADPEWWVRYRAAQALVDLSLSDQNARLATVQLSAGTSVVRAASGIQRIHKLKEGLNDRYARDILEQVIAEKGLT